MDPMVMQEIVNTFLKCTVDVLKIQTGTESTAGKPEIRKNESLLSGDLSGVIALVSTQISGSLIISFPGETFLGIMSSMLKMEFKELTPDIADGASEIANMILGQAKIALNQMGHNFQPAIPTVIMGKSHVFASGKHSTSLIVPFTSNRGPFTVEVRVITE